MVFFVKFVKIRAKSEKNGCKCAESRLHTFSHSGFNSTNFIVKSVPQLFLSIITQLVQGRQPTKSLIIPISSSKNPPLSPIFQTQSIVKFPEAGKSNFQTLSHHILVWEAEKLLLISSISSLRPILQTHS